MGTGAGRRWGLVLSGGAACGLANIGTVEVLEEAGLRPHCVAGSSMGAIIAALYALGHPASVIAGIAADLAPLSVVGLSDAPLRKGLHGGLLSQQLEEHLEPLVGDARIGECEIPFVCVAGRVLSPVRWEQLLLPGFVEHVRERVELHVFGPETPVLDALRASSATKPGSRSCSQRTGSRTRPATQTKGISQSPMRASPTSGPRCSSSCWLSRPPCSPLRSGASLRPTTLSGASEAATSASTGGGCPSA